MATPGNIDLVVRSAFRTFVLSVDPNASIDELKGLLHKRGAEENVSLPAQKQRLVHFGNVLSGPGSLQQAGVRSGDHLVCLVNRGGVVAPSAPEDTTATPTAATIRAAIMAEARRRGMESSVMEEQPRPGRHMYGGPGGMPLPMDALAMDVDNQLMQLLAALGGRVAVAPGRGGGAGGGGGQGGGGAGHPQMVMPPFGALPPGMRLFGGPLPPPHAAGGGAPPPAPAQPAAPPPPPPAPVIPEPEAAAAAQLGEMGFGEAVVRKALLLHRNDMEQALNWLLQHGDDPAAAEPLTDDQLRQIYAGGLRGPASEPEQVEQLVAMGFDRARAAAAMRRYRNMDVALAILLQQEEAAQEQQQGQQQEQQQGPQQGQEPQQQGQQAEAAEGGAAMDGAQAQTAAAAHAHDHGEEEEEEREGHQHGGEEGVEEEEDDDDDDEEEDGEDGEEDDYNDDEDMTGDGDDDVNLMHMGIMPPGGGARGPGDGNAGAAGGGAAAAGARGGGPMDDGGLGAGLSMGGFGAPPFLVAGGGGGGGMYGLGGGGSAPAVTITRGPDGNDLVLGSAGASMPPLMPARGIMLGAGGPGGLGMMGGGGGGGGLNMLADLAPLLGGGGGGGGRGGGGGGGGPDEEELMQGMGLVQQLLSAVLRDALNGQGGGQGGGPEGGGAARR